METNQDLMIMNFESSNQLLIANRQKQISVTSLKSEQFKMILESMNVFSSVWTNLHKFKMISDVRASRRRKNQLWSLFTIPIHSKDLNIDSVHHSRHLSLHNTILVKVAAYSDPN